MKADRPSRAGRFRSNGPVRSPARASARKVSQSVAKSAERTRRQLTTLFDLTPDDVEAILAISADLKDRVTRGDRPPLLQGRVLTLVFEKPSLRTRNSFEAAAIQLGGGSVFLTTHDAGLNGRESLPDVARVLERVFRRHRDADVFAIADRGFRPALAVSGRQRTFGRTASLPGTDRPVHDPRDLRTAGRPAIWSMSATATTWPRRWRWRPPTPDADHVLLAARIRAVRRRFSRACGSRVPDGGTRA